jgi:hypothetical protein
MALPPITPISWRNVNYNTNSGAVGLIKEGADNVINAGKQFSDAAQTAQGGLDDYTEQASQQILSQINNERDPAKRAQIIEAGGAFLNFDTINEGQRENVAEDRAVIKQEDDLLTSAVSRVADKERTLTNQLSNEATQKDLANKTIVDEQLGTINSINDPVERVAALNKIAASNIQQGIDDPRVKAELDRALQTQGVDIDPSAMANATRNNDFSTATYNKLVNSTVKTLQAAHPYASRETLKGMAEQAIDRTPEGVRFSDQAQREAQTPEQKEVFQNTNLMKKYISDLDNIDGPGLASAYSSRRADLISKNATAQQLSNFDTAQRARSLDSVVIPLDGLLERGILDKESGDITRTDIADATEYITKQIKTTEGFRNATAAETQSIINRSLEQITDLPSKLLQANETLTAKEDLYKATITAKGSIAVANIEAQAKAAVTNAELRANVSAAGNINSVLNPDIQKFYDSLAEEGLLFGDGKISPVEIQDSISTVVNAITAYGDDTLTPGDIAILTRNLLLSGNVNDSIRNEISLDTDGKGGQDQELADLTAEQIFGLALAKRPKGDVSFDEAVKRFNERPN